MLIPNADHIIMYTLKQKTTNDSVPTYMEGYHVKDKKLVNLPYYYQI